MQVHWWTKILLKVRPALVMRRFARELGIKGPVFDQAHALLSGVDRIDLFPARTNERGFLLVLDRKTALYFYQDGDHFVYDGYEMGRYAKGDVTIFDRVQRR